MKESQPSLFIQRGRPPYFQTGDLCCQKLQHQPSVVLLGESKQQRSGSIRIPSKAAVIYFWTTVTSTNMVAFQYNSFLINNLPFLKKLFPYPSDNVYVNVLRLSYFYKWFADIPTDQGHNPKSYAFLMPFLSMFCVLSDKFLKFRCLSRLVFNKLYKKNHGRKDIASGDREVRKLWGKYE